MQHPIAKYKIQDLPENVEHLEEAEDDDPDNEVVGGQDASPDTIPSRHKQEQNKIPLCAYINKLTNIVYQLIFRTR